MVANPRPEMAYLPDIFLEELEWRQREKAHQCRVREWVAAHLHRRSHHQAHPVEDFLFEYYAYRPSQLLRWHPGVGVGLLGMSAEGFLDRKGYVRVAAQVFASVVGISPKRRVGLAWIRDLLLSIERRPALFGCHGLHEWAMVYQTSQPRHAELPLRLSPKEIAEVVEDLPLVCTHYDAFRFFTSTARPLNHQQLVRESQPTFDQCGCLHANMDLYKWAMKLQPFCPSELVADCFLLARQIRELDMRASPYNLEAYGYSPILIELPEGRREYERRQREFAERSKPLRARLRELYDLVLAKVEDSPSPAPAFG